MQRQRVKEALSRIDCASRERQNQSSKSFVLMWLNQWAKRQGTDKDYEHLFFKKNFLAKIYDRDDVGQYKKHSRL